MPERRYYFNWAQSTLVQEITLMETSLSSRLSLYFLIWRDCRRLEGQSSRPAVSQTVQKAPMCLEELRAWREWQKYKSIWGPQADYLFFPHAKSKLHRQETPPIFRQYVSKSCSRYLPARCSCARAAGWNSADRNSSNYDLADMHRCRQLHDQEWEGND